MMQHSNIFSLQIRGIDDAIKKMIQRFLNHIRFSEIEITVLGYNAGNLLLFVSIRRNNSIYLVMQFIEEPLECSRKMRQNIRYFIHHCMKQFGFIFYFHSVHLFTYIIKKKYVRINTELCQV